MNEHQAEQDPKRVLFLDSTTEMADWLRSPAVQGYDAQRKRAEMDERGRNGVRYTEQADQQPASTFDSKEPKDGQAKESV